MLLGAPFREDKLERRSTSWTRNAGQEVENGAHLSVHQMGKDKHKTLKPESHYQIITYGGANR